MKKFFQPSFICYNMKLFAPQKKKLTSLLSKYQKVIKGKHKDEIKQIWTKYRSDKTELKQQFKEVNKEKRLFKTGTTNINKVVNVLDNLKTSYFSTKQRIAADRKAALKGKSKEEQEPIKERFKKIREKERTKYFKQKKQISKKLSSKQITKHLEKKAAKEIEKGFEFLEPYHHQHIEGGFEKYFCLPHEEILNDNRALIIEFIEYKINEKVEGFRIRYIAPIITYKNKTLEINQILSDVVTPTSYKTLLQRGNDYFTMLTSKVRADKSDFSIDEVIRLDMRVIYESTKTNKR